MKEEELKKKLGRSDIEAIGKDFDMSVIDYIDKHGVEGSTEAFDSLLKKRRELKDNHLEEQDETLNKGIADSREYLLSTLFVDIFTQQKGLYKEQAILNLLSTLGKYGITTLHEHDTQEIVDAKLKKFVEISSKGVRFEQPTLKDMLMSVMRNSDIDYRKKELLGLFNVMNDNNMTAEFTTYSKYMTMSDIEQIEEYRREYTADKQQYSHNIYRYYSGILISKYNYLSSRGFKVLHIGIVGRDGHYGIHPNIYPIPTKNSNTHNQYKPYIVAIVVPSLLMSGEVMRTHDLDKHEDSDVILVNANNLLVNSSEMCTKDMGLAICAIHSKHSISMDDIKREHLSLRNMLQKDKQKFSRADIDKLRIYHHISIVDGEIIGSSELGKYKINVSCGLDLECSILMDLLSKLKFTKNSILAFARAFYDRDRGLLLLASTLMENANKSGVPIDKNMHHTLSNIMCNSSSRDCLTIHYKNTTYNFIKKYCENLLVGGIENLEDVVLSNPEGELRTEYYKGYEHLDVDYSDEFIDKLVSTLSKTNGKYLLSI